MASAHTNMPEIGKSLKWLVLGGVLAFMVFVLVRASGGDRSGSEEIVRGQRIYVVNCGQCHGNKLEGQANWKTPYPNGRMPAPPHDGTGHTWHHPDDMLAGIVKEGMKPYVDQGYESDMPAFGGRLSDQDIRDVLSFIKSTWPEEARRWQADVSKQQN